MMKTALFLAVICSASLVGAIARAEPKDDAPKPNAWQVLSDITKAQSDTAKAIVRNIR